MKRVTVQISAASCFCITSDKDNFIRNSQKIFLFSLLLSLIFVYIVNILVVYLQKFLSTVSKQCGHGGKQEQCNYLQMSRLW